MNTEDNLITRREALKIGAAAVAGAVVSSVAPALAADNPAYRDASRSIDDRVADLLGRMTIQEKVGQMRAVHAHGTQVFVRRDGKLQIAEIYDQLLTGDPMGLGGLNCTVRNDGFNGTLEMGLGRREGAELLNLLQRRAIEGTRLGIPLLIMDDCNHCVPGLGSTVFPAVAGMGSSWNRSLQEKVGRAIALEMRSQGEHGALAPDTELTRDPRWDRCNEQYGEDPFHGGAMAAGMVRGLQGEGPNTDHTVLAILREFPGEVSTEGAHGGGEMHIGEREMREVVMHPSRACIAQGAEGVMISMCAVDGVPYACSRHYLNDILRKEMGFQGFTLGDYGALTGVHKKWRVARDFVEAAALAVKAGMDMSLDWKVFPFGEPLLEAVRRGLVTDEHIDQAVGRILRVKFRLGLFDRPYVDPARSESVAQTDEHRDLALEAARQSLILLKNRKGILPLSRKIRSIAVIGPNADDHMTQLGDYSPTKPRSEVITVLDGIKGRAGTDVAVRYARGCGIKDPSTEGFAKAVEAARASDVVVAVVGGSCKREYEYASRNPNRRTEGVVYGFVTETNDIDGGEGYSRATLDLAGVQLDLLRALKDTGVPLIVVLIHGRAMTINWIAEHADGIIDAWFPGQEGGTAIAEALFGNYNPGGRLAVSVPKHVGQLPVYYYAGRPRERYLEMDAQPLYPFGFGLSYTSFSYVDLEVKPGTIPSDGTAEVTVKVTNTGKVAGDEVVQLYIRDEYASVVRPVKQLRGFERVHLKPGETRTVSFLLGSEDLHFWGQDRKWVVEPGDFLVMVGANSRDVALSARLRVE